jgi:hypothetical protein
MQGKSRFLSGHSKDELEAIAIEIGMNSGSASIWSIDTAEQITQRFIDPKATKQDSQNLIYTYPSMSYLL